MRCVGKRSVEPSELLRVLAEQQPDKPFGREVSFRIVFVAAVEGSRWRVSGVEVVYDVVEGMPMFVEVSPTFAADGTSATFKVTGTPADTYGNAMSFARFRGFT